MAKRVAVVLFIAVLFLGTTAFAGDTPEGIMAGQQKALFIGQITEIGKTTITIKPLTVMMGSIDKPELEVNKFASFSMEPNYPKKGEYLVAVLLDDNTINTDWVFQCTSADYKTLKIIGPKYEIVMRYQKYINDGKYFEAQKKLDTKTATAASTVQPIVPAKKALLPVASSQPVSGNASGKPAQSGQNMVVLIMVAALVAAAVVSVLFVVLKRRKG